MSTHEDWLAAKERREGFAIRTARALVDGRLDRAKMWAQEFDAAEKDMRNIRRELDGEYAPTASELGALGIRRHAADLDGGK